MDDASDATAIDVMDSGFDGSLMAPMDAPSTPARVQAVTVIGNTVGPEISRPMTLTAGDVVVVVSYWNDSRNTMAVSDTTGLGWRAVERRSVPTGCHDNLGTNLQMFYAEVASSGMTSVSATQSATGLFGMFIVEYSGLATDPFDAATGAIATAPSNAMTTGPFTTAGNALVLAAFHDSAGGGEMTPGPGFTAPIRDTEAYSMLAERMVEAGTYEATANLPPAASDSCWVASVLALRAR